MVLPRVSTYSFRACAFFEKKKKINSLLYKRKKLRLSEKTLCAHKHDKLQICFNPHKVINAFVFASVNILPIIYSVSLFQLPPPSRMSKSDASWKDNSRWDNSQWQRVLSDWQGASTEVTHQSRELKEFTQSLDIFLQKYYSFLTFRALAAQSSRVSAGTRQWMNMINSCGCHSAGL